MKIQPTHLSDDVIATNCTVLIVGNSKLKQCAEMAGMEHKEFRAKLFAAKMDAKKLGVAQNVVVAITKAVPDIQAVRDLEWQMFTGFVRIAWKLARRISRWGTLEYDDAEQEAYFALVDAIYSYSQPGTQFKSWAWGIIHRRLWTAHNRNNPFSPLTNAAIELMTAYEAKKQILNAIGPVSPEDVMDALDMSEEDRAVVRDCLNVQVYSGQAMSHREGGDSDLDDPYDYTGFRRGIQNERDTVPCDFEIRDALAAADLDAIERAVVEASLEPYHGWLTDMAAKTINPKTRRPYTKKGISVILERALVKVRQAYEAPGHRLAG